MLDFIWWLVGTAFWIAVGYGWAMGWHKNVIQFVKGMAGK